MDLAILSAATDVVLASGPLHVVAASSDNSAWLPLLFLLSGPAFYMYQYTRYRNKDKRHHHERETASDVADLQAADQYVKTVTGSSRSQMSDANEHEVRG